jgi:hypothetical protein
VLAALRRLSRPVLRHRACPRSQRPSRPPCARSAFSAARPAPPPRAPGAPRLPPAFLPSLTHVPPARSQAVHPVGVSRPEEGKPGPARAHPRGPRHARPCLCPLRCVLRAVRRATLTRTQRRASRRASRSTTCPRRRSPPRSLRSSARERRLCTRNNRMRFSSPVVSRLHEQWRKRGDAAPLRPFATRRTYGRKVPSMYACEMRPSLFLVSRSLVHHPPFCTSYSLSATCSSCIVPIFVCDPSFHDNTLRSCHCRSGSWT